jgi:DNA-directed RNA polymerase II subunit RPB2
VNNAIG